LQFARILVVDDSPDVSLALATILEDAGHDIIEAEDGDQVFDLAISESPNVVLMDVMMPRVNGIDALATLKADTRTSSIPVSWSLLKVDLKTWRWRVHSVPLST
jgi:CheY-like chemotaxis protein